MTQVTAEMQEIIDRFGWAEEWTDIVAATMDLTRHVDARLTALEETPWPQAPTLDAADENERLKAEVNDLTDAAAGLADDVIDLTTEVKRITTERNGFELAHNNTVRERNTLRAEVKRLTAERDNLKFSIGAAADKIRQLTAERDCRRTTDSLAVAEVDRLIAERNALAAEVDGLRNVNAGLTAEVARLKFSIVATVNEIDKDLAADNARLRTENAILSRDYGIKRRQYDEVQDALKALQDDMR